jgi:hypothetical protein
MTAQYVTRREFVITTSVAALPVIVTGCSHLNESMEPIIDIHQHTNYAGRADEELIAHQRTMGVTHTVLLPAGRYFGLEVGAGGNETVVNLAKKHRHEFSFFANEVPYLAEARAEITTYLRRGAIGIGEQKFEVDCDSNHMLGIAAIAEEFGVPVLMHFQHGKYNTGIERFHKVAGKISACELHRPRANVVGEHRQEPSDRKRSIPKRP